MFKTTKVVQEPDTKRLKTEADFGNLLFSPPTPSPSPISYEYSLVLEQNPKWAFLDEILAEIRASPPIKGQMGPVLIVVRDEANQEQVQEYLTRGGQFLLKASLLGHVLFAQAFTLCTILSITCWNAHRSAHTGKAKAVRTSKSSPCSFLCEVELAWSRTGRLSRPSQWHGWRSTYLAPPLPHSCSLPRIRVSPIQNKAYFLSIR